MAAGKHKRDLSARAFAARCAALGFRPAPEQGEGAPVFASTDGRLRVAGAQRLQRSHMRLYRRGTVRLMQAAIDTDTNKKAAGAATPTAPIDPSPAGEKP